MISDATWDLYRERWRESIAPQYRYRAKIRLSSANSEDRHTSCSIIAPTPAKEMLDVFLTTLKHREGKC